MYDIKSFKTSEILKNGMAATIRSVRPSDKELLVEAFSNLESETIYTRFFHAKTSLTDAELARITEPDFVKEVGLVATIDRADKEVVIGAARYVMLPAGREEECSAEVAFLVEEDYQGLGIASRLLGHLVRIAREQGVKRFEAEVLARNSAMLAVFRRSGLDCQLRHETGEIHITMPLSA